MARKSVAKRQPRKGTMRRMKGGMTTGEHGISVYGDANQQTAVGNGSNVIRMHNPSVPMQGGKRMHGGDEPTAASILQGAENLLNDAKKLIEQPQTLPPPVPAAEPVAEPVAEPAAEPVAAQGGAISDWFGLGNKEETAEPVAEPVAEPATEEPAPEQPVAEQPVEAEHAWYGGKKKNAGMLAIPRMLLDMTPLRSERQSAKRQKRVNKKGKSAKKRM